ncbi:unnamed protein product [Closterium sp. NIES-54]
MRRASQPAHTSLVLGQSLQGFSPLAAAAAVTTPLTSSPSCSYPSSAASRSSTSSTSGTSSSSKGNKAGEWRVWRYLRHRWRWLSASSSLPSSSLSSSHHGQARGSSSFGLHFGLGGASLGTSSSGFGRAGRGVVVEGRRRRVRRWVVVLAATVLLVVLAGAAAVGVRRAASLIPAHDSQAMSGQNTAGAVVVGVHYAASLIFSPGSLRDMSGAAAVGVRRAASLIPSHGGQATIGQVQQVREYEVVVLILALLVPAGGCGSAPHCSWPGQGPECGGQCRKGGATMKVVEWVGCFDLLGETDGGRSERGERNRQGTQGKEHSRARDSSLSVRI